MLAVDVTSSNTVLSSKIKLDHYIKERSGVDISQGFLPLLASSCFFNTVKILNPNDVKSR